MHLFNDLWASFIYVFSLGTMVQDLCSKQLKGTIVQLISLPSLIWNCSPAQKVETKAAQIEAKKKKKLQKAQFSAGYFLLFGVLV